MAKPKVDPKLSITRAAAASAQRIDLACSPDADDVGAPYTRLLRYVDGGWSALELKQHAESLCQFRDPQGQTQLFVLSREGEICAVDAGATVSKVADTALAGKSYRLGFLNCLFQVAGALYAAGFGGQFYRRDAGGAWRTLDTSLLDGPVNQDLDWMDRFLQNPDLLDNPETNSQFVDQVFSDASTIFWRGAGAVEDAIYLVGERRDGLLCFWDGAACAPLTLPSPKPLRDVLVVPGGDVWVCSREGALLRGRDRQFALVADLGERRRLASLAWLHDRLYISASSGSEGLFALVGGDVRPIRTGLNPEPVDVHQLQAVDGVLWAVGAKALHRFNGDRWERIPVPGVDS